MPVTGRRALPPARDAPAQVPLPVLPQTKRPCRAPMTISKDVYYVSGSTAILAEDMGKALLAQFQNIRFREEDPLHPVARRRPQGPGLHPQTVRGDKPLVFCTIMNQETRDVFNHPEVSSSTSSSTPWNCSNRPWTSRPCASPATPATSPSPRWTNGWKPSIFPGPRRWHPHQRVRRGGHHPGGRVPFRQDPGQRLPGHPHGTQIRQLPAHLGSPRGTGTAQGHRPQPQAGGRPDLLAHLPPQHSRKTLRRLHLRQPGQLHARVAAGQEPVPAPQHQDPQCRGTVHRGDRCRPSRPSD